jgi:hypothetical protein
VLWKEFVVFVVARGSNSLIIDVYELSDVDEIVDDGLRGLVRLRLMLLVVVVAMIGGWKWFVKLAVVDELLVDEVSEVSSPKMSIKLAVCADATAGGLTDTAVRVRGSFRLLLEVPIASSSLPLSSSSFSSSKNFFMSGSFERSMVTRVGQPFNSIE